MKKKNKLLFVALLSTLLLSSCGGGGKDSESQNESEKSSYNSSDSSEIVKLNFENVYFDNMTLSYDGSSHILNEVRGAPEGTLITYEGRQSYIDVGTYNATAKLEKENYNTLTLSACLSIVPIDFTNLKFEDMTVKYDGKDHINDLQLTGFLPENTKKTITIKNQKNEMVTTAVDIGQYFYTCELNNKNYNSLTLKATLTIKANKEDMPVFNANDGNIYFANGLDNKFLYCLDSTSSLKRINASRPKEFNKYSSNSVIYIAGTPILNTVKEVKNGEVDVLYTDSNISDFVKYSDNIYYYSSNSLTASRSGIYKVDKTDDSKEQIVTRVFEGKADNLSIYNGYLYFSNGNESNHLYKMNLSNNNVSLVLDEKVHEYIIFNNILYCTINGLVNDYIGYINLSSNSGISKLTNAAGEFLTIKNGYLYYNYTDLFRMIDNSKLGIWRINLSNKTNEQVLACESINGFDVESTSSLVYIDTNDLHLYRYNLNNKTKEDLLEGFVPPETTPYNLGGRTITRGSKVYYLNMYSEKTLYVYDEIDGSNSQLTSSKVMDFFIYNDLIFFNLVTMFVNNDIYCANLKTGSEAYKINTNDLRNMITDGTYIYGTHYNWAGTAGGIARMRLDGSDYIKFSDINGAKNFTIKNNNLYFINCSAGQDNGNIEYISLNNLTKDSTKISSTNLSKSIKNVKQFIFDGDNIYYIYNGTIDNSIRRTSFSSLNDEVKIASSKTNPNEIYLKDGYIYYYSYVISSLSSSGFYKVNKNASKDGSQELLLSFDSKYYGSDLAISESGKLYFLNYIPKLLLGDAHTYQLDLMSKKITKIA